MAAPAIVLSGLQTETRNPRTTNIDNVSTLNLCQILHQEDSTISAALEPCLPVIADTIDLLSERVRNGGRVFYIGAGTSGRLGVLDASEIPPTYSAPTGQFIALIAGGDYALRNAKEGAEDDRFAAQADLEAHDINPNLDSLIGIASSGRTPYVLGGLEFAKSLGCPTVGIVCVHPSAVQKEGHTDYVISPVTGPESVTGSTRMKAGTATKLVLNMISTGIMIKIGKTYGNLMIDLKATNLKLKQRSRNIIRAITGDLCTQSDEQLDELLQICHGSTKLATATIMLKCPVREAEERLNQHGGVLAKVLDQDNQEELAATASGDLVLCIDAGGTSCKAVIMSSSGLVANGTAGPCNVCTVGLDTAVTTISEALQNAIDSCNELKGRRFQSLKFRRVWIAMAGYDRPSLSKAVDEKLMDMFKMRVGHDLRVSTDIDLLPACLAIKPQLDSIIVLVAGTGSIAMSYKKEAGHQVTRTGRVGGWGYLLGDDGSGFWLGREALRVALRSVDLQRLQSTSARSENTGPLNKLSGAIVQHFQAQFPDTKSGDLISAVMVPDPSLHQGENATLKKTARIAGVAKVVLEMTDTDPDAKRIVDTGATSLAELVTLLIKTEDMDPSRVGLVMSGGLMKNSAYKASILQLIQTSVGEIPHVVSVHDAASQGAIALMHGIAVE